MGICGTKNNKNDKNKELKNADEILKVQNKPYESPDDFINAVLEKERQKEA